MFVQEFEIDYVTDFDVTSSCYAWENLYQGPQYRENAGLYPQPRSKREHGNSGSKKKMFFERNVNVKKC